MPPITQVLRAQVLTVIFLVFVSGCGGGNSGSYKGAKGTVSGRMMIGGSPLKEGCQVMFQAIEGGYVATGTIKSEGKYTLTCEGSFDIPAVAYRVQMSPPSTVEPMKSSQPQDPSAMAMKVMGPSGSATVKEAAKPPFPAMYLSSLTSKLEYTVKAGPNTADFDLTP